MIWLTQYCQMFLLEHGDSGRTPNAGVLFFKTWEWVKRVPSESASELSLSVEYFTIS